MHQIPLNNQYLIHKTVFETQGLTIFKGISLNDTAEIYYNIHCIRYKKLIKYYLTIKPILKETLPLADTFVIESSLYLVFQSNESGLPLYHHSLSTHEKKYLLLSLLAMLVLDTNLPNFIRWQLLRPDYLWVDSNKVLHPDIRLELLNPELFNDFDSIQNRVAELIPAVFEAPDEDMALKQFLDNCQNAVYQTDLAMLADYKRLLGISVERSEPWLYEQLFLFYERLKQRKKQFVIGALIFFVGYYGLKQVTASDAMLLQPYQKTVIGATQFDDPYSGTINQTETITINAPPAPTAPVVAAPAPVTATPAVVATTPKDKIYTTKKGDFLVKICQSVYGDGKYAWALAKYNGLKNPSLLKVAFPLKVPDKAVIEKLYQEMRNKK